MSTIGVCRTDGSGHWTRHVADVEIIEIKIAYISGDNFMDSSFGELRVYFDPFKWDVNKHSYIYTDKQWLKHFQKLLMQHGFSSVAAEAISYSEAGMQGNNYVSLDIFPEFMRECDPLFNFAINKQKTLVIQLPTDH